MTEQPKNLNYLGDIGTLIGVGVVLRGGVTAITGNPASRIMVLGEVHGDIYTDGILEIGQGGVLFAEAIIECLEMVVGGQVVGDHVTIHAELFRMQSTGRVSVDSLRLPPGGLEQMRGSVLNARLDMSLEPRHAVKNAPLHTAPLHTAPLHMAVPIRPLPLRQDVLRVASKIDTQIQAPEPVKSPAFVSRPPSAFKSENDPAEQSASQDGFTGLGSSMYKKVLSSNQPLSVNDVLTGATYPRAQQQPQGAPSLASAPGP